MNLPDKDLAYFSEGSELFDDYVEAVDWAQDYALLNRTMMMKLVLRRAREAPAAVQDGRRGDQLPSQLRGSREPLRREGVHHAQGRDQRARRRSSASFRAAWARGRTSCAARAIRNRSVRARTAPDAA